MTVAFAGCSATAGTGWKLEKESPELWTNNIDFFKDKSSVNLGVSGACNNEIFVQAVEAIATVTDLEYLIVSWTSDPRSRVSVGFELYNTAAELTGVNRDHHLNEGTLTKNSLNKIFDNYKKVLHPQQGIVKVVRYTNLIKRLAHNDTKVIFINNHCNWDDQFFNKKTGGFLPSDLTPYTQEWILNINSRTDEEIFKLYDLQHTQYKEAGGIDPEDWVNLYNPFRGLQKDYNDDQAHAGVDSNKIYAKLVNEYLKRNK